MNSSLRSIWLAISHSISHSIHFSTHFMLPCQRISPLALLNRWSTTHNYQRSVFSTWYTRKYHISTSHCPPYAKQSNPIYPPPPHYQSPYSIPNTSNYIKHSLLIFPKHKTPPTRTNRNECSTLHCLKLIKLLFNTPSLTIPYLN